MRRDAGRRRPGVFSRTLSEAPGRRRALSRTGRSKLDEAAKAFLTRTVNFE
jgi:hypothetical protein